MLVTKDKEDFIESHAFFNPIVASFVTSWARYVVSIKSWFNSSFHKFIFFRTYLCETMQTMGKNLCYCDTGASYIFAFNKQVVLHNIIQLQILLYFYGTRHCLYHKSGNILVNGRMNSIRLMMNT